MKSNFSNPVYVPKSIILCIVMPLFCSTDEGLAEQQQSLFCAVLKPASCVKGYLYLSGLV